MCVCVWVTKTEKSLETSVNLLRSYHNILWYFISPLIYWRHTKQIPTKQIKLFWANYFRIYAHPFKYFEKSINLIIAKRLVMLALSQHYLLPIDIQMFCQYIYFTDF